MALFYPYGFKMVHIQNVPDILMLQLVSPKIQTPRPHMGARALQRAPAIRYCKPPSVKGIRTYQGRENGSFHDTKIGDIKIHPDHFNEVPTFKAVKRTNHVTWTCFNGQVVGIRCFFLLREMVSNNHSTIDPLVSMHWREDHSFVFWQCNKKRLLMSELTMKQSGWLISIVLPD